MARQTDLTPALQAQLVKAIEDGNSLECAMEAYGFSESTGYQWLAKGRAGQAPYVEFLHAVTRARGVAEMTVVGVLKGGMADDPKLAVEWLKRARHRSWGDKQTIDVAKAEAAIDLSALSRAELVSYYELRAKATTSETERAEIAEHLEAVRLLKR